MAATLLSVTSKVMCLMLCSMLSLAAKSDHLITVTDDNWKSLLKGEWMVEFMAPWCPACRSFQPVWQDLAKWSQDLEINVAVVDVTHSPGLSGRFFVTSLPTIYHVKDGQFRLYKGQRKESELVSFVDDEKWKEVAPVSPWLHPNSFLMGTAGYIFQLAMSVRGFYNTMTTVYGIPEWGCYIIFGVATIISGLIIGLLFVLCWDWLFPPKYSPRRTIRKDYEESAPVEGKDDESDLIDDSSQEMAIGDKASSDSNTSVRKRRTHNKSDTECKGEEGDEETEDKETGDGETASEGAEEEKKDDRRR